MVTAGLNRVAQASSVDVDHLLGRLDDEWEQGARSGNKTFHFKHPGALHSTQDLRRIRTHVKLRQEPWTNAFRHLENSTIGRPSWKSTPQRLIVRGVNDKLPENYGFAYRDAHSAYQQTVRYLVTGNTTFADAAVKILDGWAANLTDITGNEDMFLAAGLYGYQFANAGELLRVYPGWPKANQTAFGEMLNNIFARYNRLFLETHNDKPDFYYANWDLSNIASLMAIGIFNDNKTMYEWAIGYFKNGLPSGAVANGALPFFSIANFTEAGSGKTLMQMQESGRDQAHALLCFSLIGVIAQQGFNQGVDLFETFGREILNG